MANRVRGLWLDLSQSLGFIPGLIVLVFAALGVVLVEVDQRVDLTGVDVVFTGDGSAARTVLSVIAGSLITVAGLTFSITMVVLQLASTQFSPRILRTFFGDRVTQATIGTFVGTFVYSILVLRAVGSFGEAGFVPRLSITVASLLGIAAVILLIVFLHHVSLLVQVSHVAANIAQATLARTGALYPEPFREESAGDGAGELLESWRSEDPGRLFAPRPGYVQRVDLEEIAEQLAEHAERAVILACPGDFTGTEEPLVEIWPPEAAERCADKVLAAITVSSERDLDQDADFGVRQLADTAIRAMSSGVNDPATAVTCIGYLRAILVQLTERAPASAAELVEEQRVALIARQRPFGEYLESMLQINRYAGGDAWVIAELLEALLACARTARRCDAPDRMREICKAAVTVADQAAERVQNERDAERVEELRREVASVGEG